jgi:hypothetical protein
MTCPDIIFSVLYTGNIDLILDIILHMISAQNCEWDTTHVRTLPLNTLRVAFFLLMHRDSQFKEQTLAGWPEINISGLAPTKASHFFQWLYHDIIEKFLIDERITHEMFLDQVTDLYLVS